MSLEECGAVIRSIVTRSLVESFGYDALNRLSTFGDKVVKYDNCGNIRQKGDAGELVYTNPNRPYADSGNCQNIASVCGHDWHYKSKQLFACHVR